MTGSAPSTAAGAKPNGAAVWGRVDRLLSDPNYRSRANFADTDPSELLADWILHLQGGRLPHHIAVVELSAFRRAAASRASAEQLARSLAQLDALTASVSNSAVHEKHLREAAWKSLASAKRALADLYEASASEGASALKGRPPKRLLPTTIRHIEKWWQAQTGAGGAPRSAEGPFVDLVREALADLEDAQGSMWSAPEDLGKLIKRSVGQ